MIIVIITSSLLVSSLGCYVVWKQYIKFDIQRHKNTNQYFFGTLTQPNNYQHSYDFDMITLKPNISVTAKKIINSESVYNVVYNTDENGFRFTQCAKPCVNKYLFLGCSFMFGEGVNDFETLPYYFSKQLNFKCEVINAGYSGTGTNVAYTILESKKIQNLLSTSRNYIIYGFIEDHIFRNWAGTHQNFGFKLKNGNLIKKPIDKDANLIFSNTLIRKLHKKEAMNLTLKLMIEMDSIAKKYYKAKFLIFFYPGFNKAILEFMKNELLKNNITYLESQINYCKGEYLIKNEYHPTAKANQEYANEIYKYISSNK